MTLFVVGGMALIAVLFARLLGGDGRVAVLVWLSGCGIAIALPMMAGWMGKRAFRGIAAPLADIMNAADAVAAGDFSIRVPEGRPGEFGQLARSFNHMTKELARVDQQRRNLTADVAHELGTPLHIIQGNLEGIVDGVYEPTAAHINDTLEETHLLSRLVSDLRTLSLAESGQLPLLLEPVDITELLADIQTSFSGQAEAAGIEFEVNVQGEPIALSVMGDTDRLTQVLSNLVVNALRHTAVGGCIQLQAKPVDEWVCLMVQDNGEGIAAEDLPYIFDRFWRGDRARTHAPGVGGGLGLAIAKQLIQAHHGRIEVISALGEGTTFTIHLPSAPTHS